MYYSELKKDPQELPRTYQKITRLFRHGNSIFSFLKSRPQGRFYEYKWDPKHLNLHLSTRYNTYEPITNAVSPSKCPGCGNDNRSFFLDNRS